MHMDEVIATSDPAPIPCPETSLDREMLDVLVRTLTAVDSICMSPSSFIATRAALAHPLEQCEVEPRVKEPSHLEAGVATHSSSAAPRMRSPPIEGMRRLSDTDHTSDNILDMLDICPQRAMAGRAESIPRPQASARSVPGNAQPSDRRDNGEKPTRDARRLAVDRDCQPTAYTQPGERDEARGV